MGEAVSFKGNKDGIVLLLDCSVEFESLCQMIVQKLWQSRSFLGEHTTLVVNSGNISLDQGQRLALKVLLQSLGHEVKYFVPEGLPADQLTQKQEDPAANGVSISKPSISRESEKPMVKAVPQKEAAAEIPAGLGDAVHYLADGALVVRKNVRSGQNISYDGTLIVFGDVNAGAELVASGHILVLGTLRGVAHAGCKGNKQAIVYANNLNSLQLRIADLIARAPDGENNERNKPEIARIIDNQLVIEEV